MEDQVVHALEVDAPGPPGDRPADPFRSGWWPLVDRYGAVVAGGLVAGFLVGGVGGRLAMLLLRLTSSESVRGIESDDGFEIGRISGDSFFLIGAMSVLGTMCAFGYVVVRRWLPERRRPLQAAVFLGIVGGSAIVEPRGVDFTFLDPLWLAVVLFVALPAAYGAVMAALVEGLLADLDRGRGWRLAAIGVFVVLGFFGVLVAVTAVGGLALLAIGRRWPGVSGAVRSPVPTGLVRVGLLVVAAGAALALLRDVREIL